MLPFKAYPVAAFFVVMIWGSFLPRQSSHSGALIDTVSLIFGGYIISVVVLVLSGVVLMICRRFAAGLSCFGFAVLAVFLMFTLAPNFCAA